MITDEELQEVTKIVFEEIQASNLAVLKLLRMLSILVAIMAGGMVVFVAVLSWLVSKMP